MTAGSKSDGLVITYRGVVSPRQLDHMGHMNMQYYMAKFDEAVWHLFDRIGVTPDYIRERNRGMAAVETNIKYFKELRAGDLVTVRSGLLKVSDKSLHLLQEMREGEAGDLAAVMRAVAVHIDREARRAVPFPEEVAARAREFLVADAEA